MVTLDTATKFELVDIEKLVPYANNARTHSAEQILKLRSSLREFGFVNPVIIDKNFGIIAGHGRVTAAKAEGITEVPCVFVEHLTPAQKKAYILADNRLALDAGWDEEILKAEIEALQEMHFDISFTGFDEIDFENFDFGNSEIAEDTFDVDNELEKPCKSKFGDVVELGRHRIICGDSTVAETYEKLLGGQKCNLVCTDPPYFVNLDSASGTITNDNLRTPKVTCFCAKHLKTLQTVWLMTPHFTFSTQRRRAEFFTTPLKTRALKSARA